MQYRREIDGLRAIAVVPVILFHAGYSVFSGGYIGVDVFFVISGYLITSILITDLERGSFSLARFYERRARRILPALFVVMAACVPFAYLWMLPAQLDAFGRSLVAVVVFASNILFWQESGYFAAEAELKPLLHTWSLAVEEQYYLLFPLFLWAMWGRGRNRVLWCILGLAALSFFLADWGWRHALSAKFYLAPTRAWELLVGSLCAFATRGTSHRSSNVLSTLGLAMIVFAILAYDTDTPFPGRYALLPVVGTALIILFAGQDSWVGRVLSMRALVGIGLISYSAYLWHQPLFAFARLRTLMEPGPILMGGLSVASLLLAWGTWHWVEQPFRRPGASGPRPQRRVFAASFCVGAAFVGAGLFLQMRDGFPERNPEGAARAAHLSDLFMERQNAIRAGLCHFNQSGLHVDLAAFLDQWACQAPGKASAPAVYAIYGDSHAADKAVVLRESGLAVAQLGGAACPIGPSELSTNVRPYCDALLRLFTEEVVTDDAVIVLSNRFSGQETTAAYLRQILAFWGGFDNEVVLFSPMPEFPHLRLVYERSGLEGIAGIAPDRKEVEAFWSSIATLEVPANITLIDAEAAFCAITAGNCQPRLEDALLLIDYGHLSLLGARRLGTALQPILSRQLQR